MGHFNLSETLIFRDRGPAVLWMVRAQREHEGRATRVRPELLNDPTIDREKEGRVIGRMRDRESRRRPPPSEWWTPTATCLLRDSRVPPIEFNSKRALEVVDLACVPDPEDPDLWSSAHFNIGKRFRDRDAHELLLAGTKRRSPQRCRHTFLELLVIRDLARFTSGRSRNVPHQRRLVPRADDLGNSTILPIIVGGLRLRNIGSVQERPDRQPSDFTDPAQLEPRRIPNARFLLLKQLPRRTNCTATCLSPEHL